MNTQEDIKAGKHITGGRRRRGGLIREDPEEEEGWNELTAHREQSCRETPHCIWDSNTKADAARRKAGCKSMPAGP